MKCLILFSGKNLKTNSKCRLLKILPRALSVTMHHESMYCVLSVATRYKRRSLKVYMKSEI